MVNIIKKQRIYGLDILRVLSMMGIIGLHIINNGGMLEATRNNLLQYHSILLLFVLFYSSVNIFAMLSGFLSNEKAEVKSNKIVKLIFIMMFWSVILTMFFYLFDINNYKNAGIKIYVFSLLPMVIGRYWYITSYIFLYFLIPYINKLLKNINEKQHLVLCYILFIFTSIVPNLFFMQDIFSISNGLSPAWLIICYIFGAYLSKVDSKYQKKYFIQIAILVLISFIINCILNNFFYDTLIKLDRTIYLINNISPFTIIVSSLFILSFKNIKINKFTKCIEYLSSASFSVYIIHAHYTIHEYVLKNLFKFISKYNFILCIVIIVISIICIYIICTLLDEIRKIVFRLLKIDILIDKIGNKLDCILR